MRDRWVGKGRIIDLNYIALATASFDFYNLFRIFEYFLGDCGIFLENDFWTSPPPMNFVHGSQKYHIDNIGHVAAAPGPLACPGRSARPPSLSQPQRSAQKG